MGMTLMSPEYLASLLAARPVGWAIPATFIETGTFRGKTARVAAGLDIFDEIHTIELSPKFHREVLRLLSPLGVRCCLGDSAKVLPRILARYRNQPIIAYLDAHWFWRPENHAQIPAECPFPLWAELEAIRHRATADCVIVDDVQLFGKDKWSCPIDPKWKDVCPQSINEALDPERIAASGIIGDAYVVWRTACPA